MTDLFDYLRSGWLGHHQIDPLMPDDIEQELDEGALDFADELIARHRTADRFFDAMCDERACMWAWRDDASVDDLRVGSRVRLRNLTAAPREEIAGIVSGFGTDFWDHPTVILEGRSGDRSFRRDDWVGRGLLLVPIPVDLSTLGAHAPDTVHV